MRELFRKYIMDDYFGLHEKVANGDVESFKEVAKLVNELVFFTDNIIVEEVNAIKNGLKIIDEEAEPAKSDPLKILDDIVQDYMQILSGFKDYEKDLVKFLAPNGP